MRFRAAIAAVVVGSVLVLGAAEPAGATTSSDPSVCSVGLQLQKKVVIASTSPQYGARLTGDTTCFSYVTWDLAKTIYSTGAFVSLYSPNTSGYFRYYGEPATVHAIPRQGSYSFKQYTDAEGKNAYFQVVESSSNSMTIKYDSRIAWHRLKRAAGTVTLKASVARFSKSAAMYQGGYVAWPGAKVRFQIRSGGTWTTVKTVSANSGGLAIAHVKRGVHTWRAISVTSSTTWGKATKSHRG